MENSISSLQSDISEILTQFKYWSDSFSSLVPVTHKSKVQWFGGIPGAIIEIKEGKRLEKMINTPIIDDLSYWQISFKIFDKMVDLGEKTRLLQLYLTESDPSFLKIGDEVVNSVLSLYSSWESYSPSMTQAIVNLGEGKKKEKWTLLELMIYYIINNMKGVDVSPETSDAFNAAFS